MFLRWGARGSRRADDGKFRRRAKTGLQNQSGGTYRQWSFHLVANPAGTTVPRTVFHVAIHDRHDNRIAFLRDFSSIDKATKAARAWVDARIEQLVRGRSPGGLGSIPKLPDQEK